jgi:hypothetical protein
VKRPSQIAGAFSFGVGSIELDFHAIRRRCYLLIASAEVAEFGRRAGLRIQWSNPWGFESPLSHLVSPVATHSAIFLESVSPSAKGLASAATRDRVLALHRIVVSIPLLHDRRANARRCGRSIFVFHNEPAADRSWQDANCLCRSFFCCSPPAETVTRPSAG